MFLATRGRYVGSAAIPETNASCVCCNAMSFRAARAAWVASVLLPLAKVPLETSPSTVTIDIETLTLFLRRGQARERNLVLRLPIRHVHQSRIRRLAVIADRRPKGHVDPIKPSPLELDHVACVDQPMSRVTRAAKIDSCTGTHLQRSI